MGNWLRVYNAADVVPFIEAFKKMAGQYYLDKIDVCKDAVSIPGISMTYVLNKSLEKNKGVELLIHQEAFAIYVAMYKKSSSTVFVMMP